MEPGGEIITHKRDYQVTASSYGDLRASDLFFRVALIARGESFERTFRVTRLSKAPFMLTAKVAETTLEGVTVEVKPVVDEDVVAYDMVLRGDTKDYHGSIRGAVTVTTDVPGEESLEIRFLGAVGFASVSAPPETPRTPASDR
jgi:hypothetical protein